MGAERKQAAVARGDARDREAQRGKEGKEQEAVSGQVTDLSNTDRRKPRCAEVQRRRLEKLWFVDKLNKNTLAG